MGVDRTDYIMMGADLGRDFNPYREPNPDVYESFMDGGDILDMVWDCMSGEYCYIGVILLTADPYEGFDSSQDLQLAINCESISDIRKNIHDITGRDLEVKLIAVTNFS